MLQTLREKPAVKKVVLWVVVGAMVLGIGIGVTAVLEDLLRGGNSFDMASPWVLRVGEDTITPVAFESELRRVAREMERLGLGEMQDFQARVRLETVQRIVRRTLEAQEARKAGLSVSDKEVSNRIRSFTDLQRDGRFIGRAEYERILALNDMDVATFEQGVREDLLIAKWQSMVAAGAVVTDGDVEEELARRNQKIRFDFVVVDSGKYAPPGSVGEAEVKAWYDSHPDRYQRSEARKARYVLIDVPESDSQIPRPTDDEIRAAYEADAARFGPSLEQARENVRAELLLQRAQAEADRRAAVFRATVSDAGALDAAAAKSGLAVQESAVLTRETDPPAGLGPMFVDALFRTPQGAVGGPVRTFRGSAVFVIAAIEPPRKATLEESRSDIVADLTRDRSREAAMAAANRAKGAGASDITAIAKTLGADVQRGPLVARGEPVPGLGYEDEVERAAFTAEPGTVAGPIATQGGSIVLLKVIEKKIPDPASLAGDREKVRDELRRIRESALVGSILETALKSTDIQTNEEYLRQFGA